MTNEDRAYLKSLLERGLIHSPCLEMGVGLEGFDCKQLIESYGIAYMGTDIVNGSAVDFVIDFEQPLEEIRNQIASVGEFGSVLVFNVLEHTFEPITILDNIMGILKPGGTCAVVAPAVWPLHGFPIKIKQLALKEMEKLKPLIENLLTKK